MRYDNENIGKISNKNETQLKAINNSHYKRTQPTKMLISRIDTASATTNDNNAWLVTIKVRQTLGKTVLCRGITCQVVASSLTF